MHFIPFGSVSLNASFGAVAKRLRQWTWIRLAPETNINMTYHLIVPDMSVLFVSNLCIQNVLATQDTLNLTVRALFSI